MAAAEPRLTTQLWVQAQVRLCTLHNIPLVVARRGDADAGAVIVRLAREVGRTLLLTRQTDLDGVSVWVAAADGEALDDADCEARVAREIERDRDLWVVDVDDPRGRYWPDAPIEAE